MKTTLLLLAALAALSQEAKAQSSTSVDVPAATTENTSAATASLPAQVDDSLKPAVKYLGYLHGPGMDFSGAHQAGINGQSQMNYEQRVKLLPVANSKFEAGIEVRGMTNFANGQNANYQNGNWRLHVNFKNVLNSDVWVLNLFPRAYLPTSPKAHNAKTTVSPDFMAELSVSPKNSRFTIDSGMEYIWLFHSDGAIGNDYTKADTAIFAPWIEVDYQLTPKVTLMTAWWPEWNAQARAGAPMTSNWDQGGENEVDAGFYYEFAKGWQVNPFVATELSKVATTQGTLNNMQVNFLIIGTIL